MDTVNPEPLPNIAPLLSPDKKDLEKRSLPSKEAAGVQAVAHRAIESIGADAQGITAKSPLHTHIYTSFLRKEIAQTANIIRSLASGLGEPVELPPLAGSQNPVTRLEEFFMISTEQLSKPLSITHSAQEGLDALSELFQPIDDEGLYDNKTVKQDALENADPDDWGDLYSQFDEVKPAEMFKSILDSAAGGNSPVEILSNAIQELQKFDEHKLFNQVFIGKIERLREELGKANIKIDLSDITGRFYERDQVVSSLRAMLMNSKGDVDHIAAFIKEIQAMPSYYIPSTDLIFPEGIEPKAITKHLREYVSASEVKAKYPGDMTKAALGQLVGITQRDKPDFAFKVGIENYREILAGKLNEIFHFNPFLVSKHEVIIEGAELAGINSPSGIASEWLKGTMIDGKVWYSYCENKRKLAWAEFKGKPTDSIKKKLAESLEKLQEQTGASGATQATAVFYQAVMNLLLQSYDSHVNQFTFVDGQAWGFDEARFLAPSLAYTDDTPGESRTFVALRAAILDHPALAAPIPEEICNKILDTDISSQEKTLRNSALVGPHEDFNKRLQEKQTMQNDFARVDILYSKETLNRNDLAVIKELSDKYNVDFRESDSKVTCQNLASAIQINFSKLHEASFKVIHPDAADGLLTKVRLMKKYISSCRETGEKPTITGMRDQLYPELKTFFKVLGRFVANPSDKIGFTVQNGGLIQRSLESIINDAKIKKLVSSKEIDELTHACTKLRLKACTRDEISLTMNV